jgi:hypothetical protein
MMEAEKRIPTRNEIFVEQISLLRKINPGRRCNTCNDQLYLGFNTTPEGTIELNKCACAVFGPTEYSRIQDHLHNIESNITNQLQVMLQNLQKLADYQQNNIVLIQSANRQMYQGMLETMQIVHRNTFWGGIKFGVGIVFLYLHDGWITIKNLFETKREKDANKKTD